MKAYKIFAISLLFATLAAPAAEAANGTLYGPSPYKFGPSQNTRTSNGGNAYGPSHNNYKGQQGPTTGVPANYKSHSANNYLASPQAMSVAVPY